MKAAIVTGMVNLSCMMAQLTKVSSPLTKWKVKESTHGPMVVTMLATLKTIRCMDKDFLSTAMVDATKEDLHSTRKRAMESFPGKYTSIFRNLKMLILSILGLMVVYSMVIGRMVCNMVKVHTLMQMVEPNGAFGTKDLG